MEAIVVVSSQEQTSLRGHINPEKKDAIITKETSSDTFQVYPSTCWLIV